MSKNGLGNFPLLLPTFSYIQHRHLTSDFTNANKPQLSLPVRYGKCFSRRESVSCWCWKRSSKLRTWHFRTQSLDFILGSADFRGYPCLELIDRHIQTFGLYYGSKQVHGILCSSEIFVIGIWNNSNSFQCYSKCEAVAIPAYTMPRAQTVRTRKKREQRKARQYQNTTIEKDVVWLKSI